MVKEFGVLRAASGPIGEFPSATSLTLGNARRTGINRALRSACLALMRCKSPRGLDIPASATDTNTVRSMSKPAARPKP